MNTKKVEINNQAHESLPSLSNDSWELILLGVVVIKPDLNDVWGSPDSSCIFSLKWVFVEGWFEVEEWESAEDGDKGGDSSAVSIRGNEKCIPGSPWVDVGGNRDGGNGYPGRGGGILLKPNNEGGIIPGYP